MEKEEFGRLRKKYEPIITGIIRSNSCFYRSNKMITWRFGYDDNEAIIATYDRANDLISVNMKSFIRAYSENDLKTVEYFLLHEIRHLFQKELIVDYRNGKEGPICKEIIEKWIYESEHYIKASDSEGNENPNYFLQDLEMDAYAFSYAVMKYKYGDLNLYTPPIYGDKFNNIVNDWIASFKEEGLPTDNSKENVE
ncbi:MAG: hypothetical protein SO007_01320 [Candidatus Enteromonas sp.]|nr:hypothetical protein [Candidatus Enteromonas sp.]